MSKDEMIAKARENCRVGKYIEDARTDLKKSIEELDEAVELLSVIGNDNVDMIMAAKSVIRKVRKKLDDESSSLLEEAIKLTDAANKLQD